MALRSATPFATEKSLKEPGATTKGNDAPATLNKTAAASSSRVSGGMPGESGSILLRKRTSEQAAVQRGGAAVAVSGADLDEEDEDEGEEEDEEEYGSESAALEMQSVSEQTFVCPHNGCEKTFSRKIRLNAHMHLHYGT